MDVHESYILFEVANASYAVPSSQVRQIEMVEHVTPLPNAPPTVDGVVFTRGIVIPALNLRVRFGFEKVPLTARSRLIVVTSGGRTVGLIVDTAREFATFAAEAIKPVPEGMTGISGNYLAGIATIAEKIVFVVRVDALIDLQENQEEVSWLEPTGRAPASA